jgi:predicted alpha/beta-fold hydrolase
MNVRNCGGTEKLAATLYHSGMSDDIDRVVRFFIDRDRLATVFLVGFSMGGNQVLKLAGEWGERPPAQVIGLTTICPAMDLGPSADAIHALENRLYEWRFLVSLRRRMKRKVALFPEKFKVERWWWKSIRDFDDALTAPAFGFADATDYYDRASSSRVLQQIRLPSLIIQAKDDPFIRIEPSTYKELAANPCILFYQSAHGGHCGFLGEPQRDERTMQGSGTKARDTRGTLRDKDDGRWAERQIIRFSQFCHQALEHARNAASGRASDSDCSING